MPRRVPDNSKLAQVVGFRPTRSLDEIINRTIAYWEQEAVGAGSLASDEPSAVAAAT